MDGETQIYDETCFDSNFLSSSLSFLESSFKLVRRADLLLAGKELCKLNGFDDDICELSKENSNACLASFFSCVSIGAYISNNQDEANRFGSYAKSAIHNCQIAFLPTVVRAHLLVALMSKCLGEDDKFIQHIDRAEHISILFLDLKSTIRTLRLVSSPLDETKSESFVNCEESSLTSSHNLEMYFLKEYLVLTQNHWAEEWENPSKVMNRLLNVESNQKQETKKSFLDWYSLQALLIYVEYGRGLKKLDEATQRAKALSDFLIENTKFMPAMQKLFPQSILRLNFLALLFFESGESIFFQKVQNLYNC